MDIVVNPLYLPVFSSSCRYFHMWGGRSRGGSHFATDYFLWKMTQKQYFRGAMLRATMNEITQSLWVALQKRIKTAIEKGDLRQKDIKVNISNHTVEYIPTGNMIICKGFRATTNTSGANLKGLEGITHAIVEEAEDVFEEDFNELDATFRTTEVKNIQILVLFNPPGKNHWLIKRNYDLIPIPLLDGWYKAVKKNNLEELMSIHSTYLDNYINVNEGTRKLYKSKGDKKSPAYDADYYYRSICGFISEGKKGRIFKKVKIITRKEYDDLPYPELNGLDFGFSNDPSALVGLKIHNKRVYLRQKFYEYNLDNDELKDFLKDSGIKRENKVIADSAEPKTISSLKKAKFNIVGVDKGPGSIEYRYKLLLNYEICPTDDSPDIIKELEEHSWKLDSDKNPTDTPEDKNNHALDATMYAMVMNIERNNSVESTRYEGEEGNGEENKYGGRGRLSNIHGGDSINKERKELEEPIDEDDEDDYYRWMGYGYEQDDEFSGKGRRV